MISNYFNIRQINMALSTSLQITDKTVNHQTAVTPHKKKIQSHRAAPTVERH